MEAFTGRGRCADELDGDPGAAEGGGWDGDQPGGRWQIKYGRLETDGVRWKDQYTAFQIGEADA